MIKSMYSKVQSCVRISSSMQLSDLFDVTVGLKQALSPILFILFINYIAENLNLNDLTDKDLDLLSMFLILFADDIVLFTTDPGSLQSHIDSSYQYACIYGELGRYPLALIATERSIIFCTNIMKSDSSPIHNIYFDLCNHYDLRSCATRIHSVNNHLGYTTISQDYNVNINYFPMLKQRICGGE